jgi:hypothetical protein
LFSNLIGFVRGDDKAGGSAVIFNRARFLPAAGHEADMMGGRFLGSNTSKTDGYDLLGEIKAVPPHGQWTEITFPNTKVYRWVRYEGPAGSHCHVAKLEFYSGTKKLDGEFFASFSNAGARKTLDGVPAIATACFHGDKADGQYIGLDLGDKATIPKPVLTPDSGEYKDPVTVTIASKTPGGIIRYTTDGTQPTPENGQVYSGPIKVDKRTTICAALFENGKAPTRPVDATCIIGSAIEHHTLHIGNSLTGITHNYPRQENAAGYKNDRQFHDLGGGITKALWNAAMLPIGDPADKEHWIDLYSTRVGGTINFTRDSIEKARDKWSKLWPSITQIDDFTLQPRDFDISEEADYDNRFLNLVLQKAPNVQPWLYIEWVERARKRPTDLGKEPTTEMKKIWPAATWEESMGAMVLYGEDLKRKVNETYKGAKPIRTIPVALAMGWLHHMIENGEVPGMAKGDFYPMLFGDQVHCNEEGAFLVNCAWFAAFHGESPEGKILPILTSLTPRQAQIMQRLAWDVVKNYPDSGYYEEGTTPCGKPEISLSDTIKGGAPVTLSSSTQGAWFRYTLDGTQPSRTKGYIYCGVISVRPGMTVKVIAYKSGMADSVVAERSY